MGTVWSGVAAAAVVLWAAPASAEVKPTYDSLWRTLTQNAACVPTTYPDQILVQCRGELTIWYFTRPNHSAHPGVIKREITMRGGDVFVGEQGWYFGPDSGVPAYQKWLAQIVDLDRQMKDAMQRERGLPGRN